MPDEQDAAEALDDDMVLGDDRELLPPDGRWSGGQTVGRLAEVPDDDPHDGVGESDVLADAFADGSDLAAEEEAMHLTEGAP